MKRGGLIVGIAGLVLLLAGLDWWRERCPVPVLGAHRPGPPAAAASGPGAERAREIPALAAPAKPVPEAVAEVSHLADALNAPNGTIAQDLGILDAVLHAWQTNFPGQGNPVGENAEIAAALTGANPLRLALIPAGHLAVSGRGELCDRWGTPFFFHQLGARRMELRSAGPDRQLHTDDDTVLAPQ